MEKKTQAIAKYKKSLKDPSDSVATDANADRVNIPKKPIPSVQVRLHISPFSFKGVTNIYTICSI